MSDMKPTLPISIVALLVVAFLQVPVLVVVLTSFSETSYLTIPPQGWTLKWFAEVLSDPVYLRAIWNSVILAVSSTLLSLVLGVAAAYALFRKAIPGSEAITALLMAPLIVPSVVIGVAMLQYVTLVGLRGSFLVLIVAHVVITVPISCARRWRAYRASTSRSKRRRGCWGRTASPPSGWSRCR